MFTVPQGWFLFGLFFPASGAREIRCICGHKKTLQIREPHAFDICECVHEEENKIKYSPLGS